MTNLPHLPAVRLGRSYESLDRIEVKDHRTGCETGNIDAVMDGGLDDFIEAKLRGRVAGESRDDV